MPKRILWLDNDPNYVEPYVEDLKEDDYEVKLVTTVADAEHLIRTERYDLLILDVMIPTKGVQEEQRYKPDETERGNKTGVLFYLQNKDLLKTAGTKTLVMTVRLDETIVREFMDAGLAREHFTTKYEVRDASVFMNKVKSILRISAASN